MSVRLILLLVAIAVVASCSNKKLSEGTKITQQEAALSQAIKELIAFFDRDPSVKQSIEGLETVNYYRNKGTSELICEFKIKKGAEPKTTAATKEQLRVSIIEMLAHDFVVGDLRKYAQHGIIFTIRGVSHDETEVFRGSARFDEVIPYYNGHNF